MKIIQGDCIEVLRSMPARSVQCCVTSPPYWGLRDYGTAKWEGGRARCDHRNGPLASSKSTLEGYSSPNVKLAIGGMPFRDVCGKCGARRVDAQLGLEKTPEEYVARMVEIFAEVRRVLRDDGTLWLNLGDSYAGGKTGRADADRNGVDGFTGGQKFKGEAFSQRGVPAGLKPKDLVGIPWRVAFALQADGWWLRSDIIWHKPNPMPESVTDRPTKAHEYLFLLSKSERYYYDAPAVAEAAVDAEYRERGKVRPNADSLYSSNQFGGDNRSGLHRQAGGRQTRNRRTVWTVTTKPFNGAHFATFPPKLIEPCILAGCPEGGTVLDPFNGAGTTGLVAQQHGRQYIGIELNPAYVEMSRQRLALPAGNSRSKKNSPDKTLKHTAAA